MAKELPVTTADTIPNGQIVQVLDIVEGLVVRAVAVGDRVTAVVSRLAGGSVQEFERVSVDSHHEAYEMMVRHAEQAGADAIIGMRYNAVEIGRSMFQVMAYGTAVRVVWNAKHVPPVRR